MALAAGITAIGSLESGFLGNSANKKAQERSYQYQRLLAQQQYDLSQQGLREQYTNARKGLESAGYNPILAATNGVSSPSFGGGSVGTPSTQFSDIGSSATNAYQQNKMNNAQVEATNASASLAKEQAQTEQAKRTQMEFQNAMLDVEKHLKQKDLDNYERKFYSELYEQMQRAENYRAMANVQGFNAQTNRISANAQQMKAQTERELTTFDKRRYQDWQKRHPYQEGFLYGAGQYTGTLGKIFSGSASVSARK